MEIQVALRNLDPRYLLCDYSVVRNYQQLRQFNYLRTHVFFSGMYAERSMEYKAAEASLVDKIFNYMSRGHRPG